ARHVDHTHPHAVIALAAAEDGERLVRDVYGNDVAWLDWQRPGFDLGMELLRVVDERPELTGVVLGQHGLIDWHDDDRSCYERTIDLIDRAAAYLERHDRGEATFGGPRTVTLPAVRREALLAEVLPSLRGRASRGARVVATVHVDAEVLRFVSSVDARRLAELGTSCPDHFLRTKIKPLLLHWDPASQDGGDLVAAFEAGLERYRADYEAYYRAHARADSPPMRDPTPTVILIPGVGMLAFGKTKSESRVTAEFYRAAIEVMRGAESVSRYMGLPAREAFDIEYWALEEAKLRRMPAEREFARRVAMVVGAGGGIGRAVAERLADEGAHVVCADRDLETAEATAAAISHRRGRGIGFGGTGASACGPALATGVDVTDRSSVRAAIDRTVLAYGGLDDVIVTAGIFPAPDAGGVVPDHMWGAAFAVNAAGPYLVADEARRVWEAQGLDGTLVVATSVNAVVAKRGSLAYDASKAAAAHVVRELAIELAPLVRVNGLAPATVVEGSSMFPRDRVLASLAKYGLQARETESTETLRARLGAFYARRTLTGAPITPADQAEAALLLAGRKLSKTTGQTLVVDGGLVEAFLR
ncbi:MAG: bifunctional rhamnulose-1-phosphate aldolase/short-chain dehydrogenase, partial [Deinococcus-Thermus bacterium]|nr:bifunctional rhamnulose-1-phosphate aldolase/short-chain dehydrogenase [Deinococcota bacterium]